MKESVIDFPKADGLCQDIWEKVISYDGINEIWQIKPDVYFEIDTFIKNICNFINIDINDIYCHITGSITSNQYTKNTDIDIHLLAKPEQRQNISGTDEEIQKKFANAIKQMRAIDNYSTYIGSHPFEVYFQPNKFQDYMSVGCYAFYDKKWLVGPELTDPAFNPYSEYYLEIQEKSNELAQRIRNMILSIYEITIVYKKNFGTDLSISIRQILLSELSKVQELFDNIRNMRKVYSSPNSIEEATKFRNSRKWKIADASFKLFDKYGYMAILKQFIENYKLISASDELDEEIIEDMLSTVKNYINNADKLAEQELFENEEEQLDEGIKENVASFALSLALLIPGIVSSQTIEAAKQKLQIDSLQLEQKHNIFIEMLSGHNPNKMMNEYKMWQACNILALTLYGEGRGEIRYGGLDPITDVILNRTAKTLDIDRVANVCVGRKKEKAFQYSYWNNNKKALQLIISGEPVVPSGISNNIERKAWEICLMRAVEVLTGKYKVKDKNINSYHVKNMENPPTWSDHMTNTKTVGNHKFGYIKTNDPTVVDMTTMTPIKKQNNVYIVKKGDSLWKIAKQHNTTITDIATKNKIDVNGILKIGQKIKI